MLSEETYLAMGRKLTNKYIRENVEEDLSGHPGDSLVEKLYNRFHPGPHVCPECGQPTTFRSFSKGYTQYCSVKCATSSESRNQKTKQTCLKRYGRLNGLDVEKSKRTCLKRYGVEHPQSLQTIKDKTKQTCLKRYGRLNGLDVEKSKLTCMERYGVEYTSQVSEYIEKSKQTKLDKYGNSGYCNPEKSKRTCLERYGVEYASQSIQVQQKMKATLMERYGAPTYMQSQLNNPDIIEFINGGEWLCKCPHEDCNKCSERTYTTTYQVHYGREKTGAEQCTKLLPIGVQCESYIEKFVMKVLDEHDITYIKRSFKIIPPKQLDIYIPDRKIAIECNGVFWHSDKVRDKNYQWQKKKMCDELGIQLISIWEDWIVNKPEVVESIILSKLGIYEHTISARQCTIKKISQHTYDTMMANHLQGTGPCKVRYGLYYKGSLVSAAGFGMVRRCMDKKSTDWELIRYCCKPGWKVRFGASKIFSHFINDYRPTRIVSFSSNDISTGDLYKKLGFEVVGENKSYWYVDSAFNRHHRYKYRKSELVKMGADPSKTEYEITNELHLYRIWDTGQTKWMLTL